MPLSFSSPTLFCCESMAYGKKEKKKVKAFVISNASEKSHEYHMISESAIWLWAIFNSPAGRNDELHYEKFLFYHTLQASAHTGKWSCGSEVKTVDMLFICSLYHFWLDPKATQKIKALHASR